MRAICLSDATPTTLFEADIPEPQPGPADILIQVHAAGVTPTELLWYPTTHTKSGAVRTRAVPGHEFSGVVAALGADVRGFTIGHEVYGMNDWFADGATAAYCLTQPAAIASKPRTLTHAQAASVPISALTAWQALCVRALLQRGERVLIHGGAGSVGAFAIQLARIRGARVTATASARHLTFVRDLGAEQAVDYRVSRFEEVVRDFDVVFDTVGGDTLDRSWSVLKPGGRLITIATGSSESPDPRVKQAFFIVEANAAQLSEIAGMLDRRDLQTFVAGEFPLHQASRAYASRAGGKAVVVTPIQNRDC